MHQLLNTPLGPFHAHWTDVGLRCFEFVRGLESMEWTSTRKLPSAASLLKQSVRSFFATGIFDWDLKQLDWEGVSPFQQRVLRECYEIPSGTTWTYGELAERVGSPGAARAVGGAMARNRWPLLIPCHRVVGGSGKLTGYSGVGGVDTKLVLLDLERKAVGSKRLVSTKS